MKQNIGVINAIVRITCGFTLLAWTTAKLVRRPHQTTFLIVAMMGAMKVAEGIARYCVVTGLLSNDASHDNNDQQKHNKDNESSKQKHLSELDEKSQP
jgi:hypothetical protein